MVAPRIKTKHHRILLITLLLVGCSIVSNKNLGKDCAHTEAEFRCVEYVENYDGDTIKFNIPGIHPLFGKEISIRVFRIDTPEMRTNNPCEKSAAKKAKEVVRSILLKSKRIDLKNVQKGKYFRVVADVYGDSKNLKDTLIQQNLGYSYSGGTKSKTRNWCKK